MPADFTIYKSLYINLRIKLDSTSCFGTTDSLLTKDLSLFAPRVYGVMETVNNSLQAIGYALLVILTLWNVVHSTTTLAELKRPSVLLKVVLRFMITKYIIGYGWTVVNQAFSLSASLTDYVFRASGLVIEDVWQLAVPDNIPSVGVTDWLSGIMNVVNRIINPLASVPALLLGLIAYIVALVLCVTLILTVMGRFFKIYLMAALSPIPLATFGSETTHDMGRSFIRGFLAVSLEGLVIGLAMIVFGAYLAEPITTFIGNADLFSWLPSAAQDMTYCFSLIFNMLLFLGIIKGSDHVIQRIFGV